MGSDAAALLELERKGVSGWILRLEGLGSKSVKTRS